MDDENTPIAAPTLPAFTNNSPAVAPAGDAAPQPIVLGGHGLTAEQIAESFPPLSDGGANPIAAILTERLSAIQSAPPAMTREARRLAAMAVAGRETAHLMSVDGKTVYAKNLGAN